MFYVARTLQQLFFTATVPWENKAAIQNMIGITKTRLLFLTILIEGYVVLACELLAMRQLTPFVGSGVEIMAIVISGVLLPLAIGYHYGGTGYSRSFSRSKRHGRERLSIRRLLLRNILAAFLILSLGLSYLFLEHYFGWLAGLGIRHRLWQTALYAACFLVLPVFLLGQTVPLISHYFSRRNLSEITGTMLFFSTAGSFLGSIFSTLVLMSTIGVHNTVIVTLGLLFGLCLLLERPRRAAPTITLAAAGMAFVVYANSDISLRARHIVSDNAYNIIRVVPKPERDGTLLMINRSPSSLLTRDPDKRFPYLKFIEANFIETMEKTGTPREILIIGAGGFTIGIGDEFNRYTFVDIDPDLKKVAESSFLPDKLPPTKTFVPASARAFLVQDRHQYDLVIVDVAQQRYSIPMECMTLEFLQGLKAHLKKDGILIVDMLSSPDFRDKFSVRYDRTFSQVFPVHSREIIADPLFNPWSKDDRSDLDRLLRNNLYIYFNDELMQDTAVYTDDKNTYSLDRP